MFVRNAIKASHRAVKACMNSRWSCQFKISLFGSIYLCLPLSVSMHHTLPLSVIFFFFYLHHLQSIFVRTCTLSLSITAGCVVWRQRQSLPSQIPPQSRLCDRDGVSHSLTHTPKKKPKKLSAVPNYILKYAFFCFFPSFVFYFGRGETHLINTLM